jgi:hypothetical protein
MIKEGFGYTFSGHAVYEKKYLEASEKILLTNVNLFSYKMTIL